MLTDDSRTTTQQLMRTASGRALAVSRIASEVLPDTGRIVLGTTPRPYQADQARTSLTAAEARQPAGTLLRRASVNDIHGTDPS